ncbi:MAG: chemotaxis protein CheW [Treponema sp.]|nr:chemotaxis protein CheW [Treponema sp.]
MEPEHSPGGERYLVGMVLGEYYAVPARFIGEIALFDKVYPLPLLPDYVLGIINRYSAPYALLDTGLLLAGRPGQGAKVLVLKETSPHGSDSIALLIDDVLDIVEIPSSEQVPVEGDTDGLVAASFPWKGKNTLVLDIRGIITRAAGDIAV